MKKITDIYRILYSGWYSLALFLFVPAFLYLLYLIFAVALHNDQRLTLISFWGLFGLLGDYMVFNDLFIKNGKESVPVSGLLQSSYYGRRLLQKEILADALRRFAQLGVLMGIAAALGKWCFAGSLTEMTAADCIVLVLSVYLGNTVFLNALRYIHTFSLYWICAILCSTLWDLVNAILFAVADVMPQTLCFIIPLLFIIGIAVTALSLWHMTYRYDLYFGKGEKCHA